MRIAVVSPHASKNGNTTLALLIAMRLSSSGKKTCVTHVQAISDSFYRYLNFTSFQDKTSTSSQIVKILKEGGLSKDDVSDYCKQVLDDLEAFANEATNFYQDDMNFMTKYIAKSFPHDNVVFDVDDNSIEQNKNIIKLCDVIVLNVTQSISELRKFSEMRTDIQNIFGKKPIIVVINKYNSTKSTIKEVANWMGAKKPNGWLVLHENPWITWATNHGQLNQLFRKIESKDKRVLEINNDLGKICVTIARAKQSKDKKGGGR